MCTSLRSCYPRAKGPAVSALRYEANDVPTRLQNLVRSSLYCIQLHHLVYFLSAEYDWTRRAPPRKRLVVIRSVKAAQWSPPHSLVVTDEAAMRVLSLA